MNMGRDNIRTSINRVIRILCVVLSVSLSTACNMFEAPDGRSVSIPAPAPSTDRYEGLNEKQNPVTRVKLGRDLLVPVPLHEDPLPDAYVGPFELRGETLASALQLILDDYDISMAFETDEGLRRRITVSNLHGQLPDVVRKVCGLANLYCHFEQGTLTIKNTETFVVDLPPISLGSSSSTSESGSSSSSSSSSGSSGSSDTGSASEEAYTQIASGLTAVLGGGTGAVTIDTSTRVLIYTATQRSQSYAQQYFARLRKNTALIIFETNIWEVTLDTDNRTGINWNALVSDLGNFTVSTALSQTFPAGTASPITITPAYTGSANLQADAVLKFISERGAVKTVSQPQITVLSGSTATLSVSQLDNYVSGTTRTAATPTTAEQNTLTTGTVTTGLTMSVTSAWDQSTVYGSLNISLDDLLRIETFSTDTASVQLPHTTRRSLQTEIRVRPGDAILVGGLVSERNNMTEEGPGFMKPLFATSRALSKASTELVFLLRPRVVVFDMGGENDTQPVVDAPRDGIEPQQPAVTRPAKPGRPVMMKRGAPAPVSAKSPAAAKPSLPGSLSAEALAPQAAPSPSPSELPASLQDQMAPTGMAPVSVTPAPTPAPAPAAPIASPPTASPAASSRSNSKGVYNP